MNEHIDISMLTTGSYVIIFNDQIARTFIKQ